MNLKQKVILSSSGLRNIIPNSYENEFTFILNKEEVTMLNVFAEFISPIVSHLHQLDPTIDTINLNDYIKNIQSKFNKNGVRSGLNSILFSKPKRIFSKDIISLFKQIATGHEIEIDEKQSFKMKLVSILLGNEELYEIINEICPDEVNESNFEEYLNCLPYFMPTSQSKSSLETFEKYTNVIEFISSHFDSIDENKLLNLPKSVLYSIISNGKLKLQNEDSLLDFIQKIYTYDYDFNNNESIEDIDILDFYEQVDLSALSEQKFKDFLEELNPYKITSSLWQKLCKCLTKNPKGPSHRSKDNKHLTFEYDGNIKNCFNGIIHHYSEECGGNVDQNKVIKITASSAINGYFAHYVADLDNNMNYFSTLSRVNSWLQYDFKEKKVNPTFYAIRTRHDFGKGHGHPKSWVVEGSNSGEKDDWSLLDSRADITELDDASAVGIYDIDLADNNAGFRYIRVRQVNDNTKGSFNLAISALEFFGSVSLP